MEIARESIFISSLRSLCKVFFSIIGLFLALFVCILTYAIFSSPYEIDEKSTLTLQPNLNGEIKSEALTSPAILRINIHGVIGTPKTMDSGYIETILLDSRRNSLSNGRVKAILLHLNTPGGTVVDSDNIYRMLKEYKQKYQTPIYAYVDGLCASGGMYIASAADKIYASPTSIIGSVGVVFGPFFNFVDAIHKIGVQSKTLTQGLNKDTFNPFRTWSPEEAAPYQAIMSYFYQRFVDIVTQARPELDKEKLIQEYGAKIFDAPMAQSFGYIDVANVEYSEAMKELMIQAKIDPSNPYQIVTLTPKPKWLEPLLGGADSLLNGKLEHTFNLGEKRPPSIRDQFSYIYEPGM